MQKRSVWGALAAIAVAVVVVNAIGYFAYRHLAKPKQTSNPSLTHALRAAGLGAMEKGDFDFALKSFEKARESAVSDDERAELDALIAIARASSSDSELVDAVEPIETATKAARPTPRPTPRSTSRRTPIARSTKARSTSTPVEVPTSTLVAAAPTSPDQPGRLLITSKPTGLGVSVNGRTFGPTPRRIRVKPGTYRVALLQDDAVIYQDVVDVDAGRLVTVDPDLTAKLKPRPTPKQTPTVVAIRNTPATSTTSAPRGFRVATHKGAGVSSLSKARARRIFKGEETKWDDGTAIRIVLPPRNSPEMKWLCDEIIGMPESRYRRQLLQAHFGGGFSKPLEAKTSAESGALIAQTTGAIGAVDAGASPDGVRLLQVH